MDLTKLSVILLSGFVLAACGGGGGSSGSDGGASSSSSSSSSSGSSSSSSSSSSSGGSSSSSGSSSSGSSSSSSGSSGGTDSAPPQAEIIFPWKISRSDQKTLLVKGVASDENGIRAVRVNGIDAELTVVSSVAPSPKSPNMAPLPAFSGTGSESDGSGTDVTWEVSVPAQDGESTELVVETEDDQGNLDSEAETAQIIQKKVPTSFVVDEVHRRLIGQANNKSLLTYGLDDESYSSVELAEPKFCSGLGYRPDQEKAVCATLVEDWFRLTQIDLESGEDQVLFTEQLALDPEEWSFANVLKLEVSEDGASAYILTKFFSSVDYALNKPVIFRYDFSAGELVTLVDGEVKNGDKVTTDTFTLADDGIVVFNDEFGGVDAAYLIDYAGESLTPVSLLPDLILANLDVNTDGSLLFTAGFDGIAKTDVAEQSSEVISLESDQSFFQVDQIRSVRLDEANNRLLIGDDGFDYVLAVDTETGERSEFAGNGVGTGKRMLALRSLALDEVNAKAYILDDGGNATSYLIEVDLTTGNRSILADFGDVCHQIAQEVVLHPEANQAYAVFEGVVYTVNLADGSFAVLTGDECGAAGFAFTGGDLDIVNGRLLLTDTALNGVAAVDLATGAYSVLIESDEELDVPVDLVVDTASNSAYIVSQAIDGLHQYDLETGQLVALLDACLESSVNDILDPNIGSVQNVTMDPGGQYLWISGDRVGKYNLQSPTCQTEIGRTHSVLDVKVTSKGQLLGTVFNQMIQLDFETGEAVVISK